MASLTTARSVAGFTAMVPGKAPCTCETPKAMGGATMVWRSSPSSLASSSAMIRSVPSGPDGPCCSVPPTGMTRSVLFSRYSCTSCQRASLSSTLPTLHDLCPGHTAAAIAFRTTSTSENQSLISGRAPTSVGRSSSFAPAFWVTSSATLLL